jgi:hypothetical protein
MQNTVTDTITYNKIVINTDENTVNVSQPVTNTVSVITLGPQGASGPQGPQGPVGSIFPYTGSAAITGSLNVIGNQTITGSLTVSGSSTFTNIGPAIFSGSVTSTGGFTGSLAGTASFASTASYVSSNFQYEVHVSQVDGNDTTGNGDLLKPVATIGKALLIVSASVASTDRRTIIVHPGTYIENITVNTTNTYFFSTGLLGANCLISGSVTVSAATRMSGLKMTNLIVSSSAPVYINNCAVDKQMTVSGSGYLEVQNTSLQCTSGIQVVGPASSGVIFENCLLYPLTVNNASAAVYIISCNQAITPTLTAGALTITRSTISSLTSGATSTALTTAAGSVLVLESCNVYNSLLTSHAAITANGFYSIKNIIYNRSASTLASLSGTGGPLATVTQFQYINADNINSTQGLTVTGSVRATSFTGSIQWNNITNIPTFATTGSNTFSGNQLVVGNVYLTNGNRIYIENGSITPSQGISSHSDPITQLSTAGEFSGETILGVAGENLELGGLIHLYTDGTWYKANATPDGTRGDSSGTSLLGILVGSTPANMLDSIVVLLHGNVYTNQITGGGTPGSSLWINTEASRMRLTAPTSSRNIVRQVGHILTTNVLRFTPDNRYSIV